MAIQIFGTKKCRDTQKALRYFKERGIPVHFVNIAEKPVSGGELDAVIRSCGIEALIDTAAKDYASVQYLADKRDMLLTHQAVIKTPLVRNGNAATAGIREDIWKSWKK
ncbi:MAG: ArsC family transcriptional regulator [Spirochaetes bacterium]|nr:ArsC family transcriptional regulator [Spirochaetota bacterium]